MSSSAPDLLPDQFEFAHNYAYFLHDRLASIIVDGERDGVFNTEFEVDTASGIDRPDSFPHIFEWFERYERSDLLADVLVKGLLPALLSDFCHFVYESLSCSRKGKLSVAFALLRKPLFENLFYMEWLLSDPQEFLETFYNRESIDLSFGRVGSNPERIKSIVAGALARCPHRDALDASHLYELRFDRNFPGLYGLCNQATHLVTTKAPIATFRQNFNFIFSNEEDNQSQWEALYRSLPHLLFYATDIAETLLSVMVKSPAADQEKVTLQRAIGFLIYASDVTSWSTGAPAVDHPGESDFQCPHCLTAWKSSREDLTTLFFERKARCPDCRRRISLDDLLTLPNT